MRDFLKKLFRRTPSEEEVAAEAESAMPALELPIETVMVAGRDAIAAREKLASRPDVTPIIMGEPDEVEQLWEFADEAGDTPEQVIEAAGALDVEAWLRDRERGEPLPSGPWPRGESGSGELGLHLDTLSRKPKKHVMIGLFPTRNAWEAPALMRYGGWNENPEAHVHVALHKRWHERHAARIACMSNDIVECLVDRPPATREAALVLAREQYLYCPDIVDQGVESVEALAATLLNGRVWYFWWD